MKKWMKVIGWTLLACGVYYMIEIIFNAVLRLFVHGMGEKAHLSQYVFVANFILKVVTLVVFGLWYKISSKKRIEKVNYRETLRPQITICLVGIGLFGQYVMGFVMAIFRLLTPSIFDGYEKITQAVSLNNGHPIAMLILVGLLGPIAEEVLFRGVIYGKLRDVFSVAQAAILSGAIFGIYHKNIVQAIYATLFGILLAVIYERTHTLWGAIVTHMMFNLSSYLLVWVTNVLQKFGNVTFALFLLGLYAVSFVIVIVSFILFMKQTKTKIEPNGDSIDMI